MTERHEPHGHQLPPDLAAVITHAGVDRRLPERALQDAIKGAIADRRGYLGNWYVGDFNWTVELPIQQREDFHGRTLIATA